MVAQTLLGRWGHISYVGGVRKKKDNWQNK